jgi:hypothetical protein
MRARQATALLLSLLGTAGLAPGRAAPATPTLAEPIPLLDPQGRILLSRSRAQADFLPLVAWFDTQANLAYCGVASAVIALNSLALPAPPAPSHGAYRFWTQTNLFTTPAARGTGGAEAVARRGMTLGQLAGLLAQPGLTVERWHGDQLSLPQLRGLLRQGLADPSDRLLVNYHRAALGQSGGGHIAPLAAYDEASDRVLILDVARYRYPSVWVPTRALWQAIRSRDADSGLSRGLVRLRPAATPRSGP